MTTNATNPMLAEALRYRSLGLSVIPLRPRDKRPLFSWSEYQNRIATEKEIREWWTSYPKANVGIVTGRISGIVVVDLDIGKNPGISPKDIWDVAPTGIVSQTGSGYHLIYRYSQDGLTRNTAANGIDTRGDGGYIVAPPSVHPNGKRYKWVSNDFNEIGTVTNELVTRINKQSTASTAATTSDKWLLELMEGVSSGGRNQALAKLAGYYAGKGLPQDIALQTLLMWNERNEPPMTEREVVTTVNSVYRTAANNIMMGTEPMQTTTVATTNEFSIVNLQDYMLRYGDEAVTWMISDWMPQQTIAFLVSPPGSYKTWLILDLAVAVAGGKPFLGTFPVEKSGPVLLVQQEDHHGGIAERLANIISGRYGLLADGQIKAPPELPIYIHTGRTLRFDNAEIMAAFEQQIATLRPALVIIDPLYSAATTDDYMAKTTEYMFALKRMRDEYGCSFVVVHHTKKRAEGNDREGLWGSQFLNAFLETGWQIRKTSSEDTVSILRHFKVKGVLPELRVTFGISTEPPYQYTVTFDDRVNQTEEDIVGLLSKNGAMSANEIALAVGKHRSTISRRLKLLEGDGVIIKESSGKYTTLSNSIVF